MQKIVTFLWFNDQAGKAARFYVSIFKKSKILGTTRYGAAASKASGRPKGSVMTVKFRLEGQDFVALNGGPHFKFTEAVSLVVNCRTQKEIDTFWRKLSEGGEEGPCGWLKDKFGLSWQIVPTIVGDMLNTKNAGKLERVMQAVLRMQKLDIKALKQAADSSRSKS